MTPSLRSLLLFLVLQSALLATAQERRICTSPTNTFTAKVDLHASERGYYIFEECGDDWINPTLGLEFGTTYTFVQKDRTNFYHPIDISYFPDATHVGADLLDPRIDKSNSAIAASDITPEAASLAAGKDSCAHNMTCPAPMYFLNDGYLGAYSNIAEVAPITVNQYDFGLDAYEDFFFRDLSTWTGFGTFSFKLKFDDESYVDNDLFYYCRIHQYMAGRIKLLKNGEPVNAKDQPPMYYQMETPGEFDQMCGTYGLDAYQLPHPECPSRFVCDPAERMSEFASCIDAMNCLMVKDMTTMASTGSELALFIHQMIPHHQNAVNMAKALLKAGFLPCEDVTDKEDPYCIMQNVLFHIVNRQNHEIGIMYKVLAAMGVPPTDDCEVLIPDEDESSHAFEGMVGTAAGAILGTAAQLF